MSEAQRPRLLVVDDDVLTVRALERSLSPSYDIQTFTSSAQARSYAIENEVDLALFDVSMPTYSGLDLLEVLRKSQPRARAIMMSGGHSTHEVVRAIQLGATDFFTKPVPIDALQRRFAELSSPAYNAGDFAFIGESEAVAQVRRVVDRVCVGLGPVFVVGESGTGKELVARAIHRQGARSHQPFVAVNCAALTENLVDSELFGHARGSFIGATTEHAGLFEAAQGGVLFLDEVGQLPLSTQVRLLRALQNGEIRRVGSTLTLTVDVRVVAATNVDLRKAIRLGRFREDLYFRLSTFQVSLPPLRGHLEDLPALVAHLLVELRARSGKTVHRVAPEALEALSRHHWPGNVRELANVLEYAMTMATTDEIHLGDLPELSTDADPTPSVSSSGPLAPYSEARASSIRQFDRDYLTRLLATANGVLGQASRISGIDRSNLRRLLVRYNIKHREELS